MRIKLNVFFILFLFVSYYIGWLQHSLILFLSVVLHELGHVLAARRLKLKVYEVELLPYGGAARMEEPSKFGGAAEALISAAGPLTSLILALLGYFFCGFSAIFEHIFKYNLILCIFNLFPVIPLDGGRIARNLMIFFMGYRQATRILILAGKAAAFFLTAYNIRMLAAGSRSIAPAVAGVFIYIGTLREEKFSSYYYLFTGNSIKSKLTSEGRIRKRYIKAGKHTRLISAVNRFSPVTLCFVQVLDASGRIIKVLEEDKIMEGILKYGYDGRIEQILKG